VAQCQAGTVEVQSKVSIHVGFRNCLAGMWLAPSSVELAMLQTRSAHYQSSAMTCITT
jgi:hypothetical protein